MELYEYLNNFHPLKVEDYDHLKKLFKKVSVHKDQYLIVPGQIQKDVYFVREGIQMSYLDSTDKVHVMAFTYPPNISAIPESFFYQKPSSYFLKCLTNSEFDAVNFEALNMLFERRPSIERLFRKMTEAVLVGVINRHMELHTLTMQERFKTFCNRSGFLLNLVPHKYVASYLGIDATNFSKLYNTIKY